MVEPREEFDLEDVHDRVRRARDAISDELGRDTETEVFDRPTLTALWKLVSQGVLETLDYPVSTGKEANVFHGTGPESEHLAVKIFRVNTATFRSHLSYIEGDPRFSGAKGNRREIVSTWTQKEFRNLAKMTEVGVRVPLPIAYHANVLVMEFIGDEGTPAPLLQSVAEVPDAAEVYRRLLASVKTLWRKADLVHADLSEFNIMVKDRPEADLEYVIIDVGQAVMKRHPQAEEFLRRDLRNLVRFFGKHGVAASALEAMAYVRDGEVREGTAI
ncbi:MAG: serine protein kinase RIO [Methanobacteriota archaeon]